MDFLFLFSHSKVCESIIAFMGGLVVRKKRLKSSLGGIGSYAMDKETREIDENFLKENLLSWLMLKIFEEFIEHPGVEN